MNKLFLPDYNLEATLLGGQSFAWNVETGVCGEQSELTTYFGFTAKQVMELQPRGDFIFWQTFPKADDFELVFKYLRIDAPYEKILTKISKDNHLRAAIKKYQELRLLKQDFEQTLFSFILSSNNTIASIRKSVRLLNQKLGAKIVRKNESIFLFPSTESIAEAPLELLLETKIGFRAKYLKNAAKHLLETKLTEKIDGLSEREARSELIKIPGIADKISDCILAFGLGFDNVTPLDVWSKRVLTDLYGLNEKMKYEEMRKWTQEYFEGHAAWAGQFLFEYIRTV